MFVALSPYIGRGNTPEVAHLPRSLSNTSVESVSSPFPPTTPPVTMKILNGTVAFDFGVLKLKTRVRTYSSLV